MKPIVTIGLLAVAALMGGCSSEQVRSYEWYLEHREEARTKAKACSRMAEAARALDVNCAAAQQAVGTRRRVGPVTFSSERG